MRIYSFLIALTALCSCAGNMVKINGEFNSVPDGDTILLESVSPTGRMIVDTTQTKKGAFSFKIKLQDREPAIYNVKYKEHIIPIAVSPGERIKISSLGNIARNYSVEGSDESALMKQITSVMNIGAASLDSLASIYINVGENEALKQAVGTEYMNKYYGIKRDQIKFIVSNPKSLAALYALYQRLPNDNNLFNGENDVIYYQLVADSLGSIHPNSPYLPMLQKEISAQANKINMTKMLTDAAQTSKTNYPDIELPDMYGKKVKLSSLNGKVILLDFWAAKSEQSKMQNAELMETYSKFADKGFEVYQVALDDSKPLWVTTVQDQKLPWVSVCDFKGTATLPVRMYNVTQIPTNFVIDRAGNIVAKNLFGDALENKLNQLL